VRLDGGNPVRCPLGGVVAQVRYGPLGDGDGLDLSGPSQAVQDESPVPAFVFPDLNDDVSGPGGLQSLALLKGDTHLGSNFLPPFLVSHEVEDHFVVHVPPGSCGLPELLVEPGQVDRPACRLREPLENADRVKGFWDLFHHGLRVGEECPTLRPGMGGFAGRGGFQSLVVEIGIQLPVSCGPFVDGEEVEISK